MAWTTIAAIYFVIWWIVLFVVLPWGVRPQSDDGEVAPGTDPGAPSAPALIRKAIWTTIVSGVVFGVFYALYVTRVVTLDDLARWLHVAR